MCYSVNDVLMTSDNIDGIIIFSPYCVLFSVSKNKRFLTYFSDNKGILLEKSSVDSFRSQAFGHVLYIS